MPASEKVGGVTHANEELPSSNNEVLSRRFGLTPNQKKHRIDLTEKGSLVLLTSHMGKHRRESGANSKTLDKITHTIILHTPDRRRALDNTKQTERNP
ncbi:hypothetical protein BgiBS90_025646, partial [Biomphalaria glabrata]